MVLFTSAAPGKKAAPKAAPRRRPQPAPPSAQPPAATASDAQAIPPPTQIVAAVEQSPSTEQATAVDASVAPAPAPSHAREIEPEKSVSAQQHSLQRTQEPATVAEKAPTPAVVSPPLSGSVSAGPTTPPQTQTPPAPDTIQQDARPSAGPQSTHGDESASTAIAGAQQRLEDYYVSGIPTVQQDSAQQESNSVAADGPPSGPSARRVSIAEVLEAASASTPQSPAAARRKTRAVPADADSAPRPAKRTRRAASAKTLQSETSTVNAAAGRGQENGVVAKIAQDVDTAPPRRKQPTRRAAGSKRKVLSAETVVEADEDAEAAVETASPAVVEPEEASEAEHEEGQSKRTRRKKAKAEVNPKKPRRRRRKIPRAPAEGEEQEQQDDDDGSDPELHEIDPNTVSMWEITHDTYHGKMSERGKALQAIDWDEEKVKRRAAAELIASGGQHPVIDPTTHGVADGVVQSTEGANGVADPSADGARQSGQDASALEAAQDQSNGQSEPAEADGDDTGDVGFMMDEDGNIVVDPTTMVVDRQAEAVAAAGADRPVEEINDLTTFNNRTTWLNENRREPTDRVPLWKWKSDPWSEEQTDEFYDALRMFGTDFLIISKMFPPKTRRMIKAKFTREEKLDPDRINRALNGQETRKLDLEYYAQKTSREVSIFTKYNGLEDAQNQIVKETSERHAELATAAAQEEQREAEKRLQESLQKAKQGKKARKSKKSKMGGMGGFGGGGGPDDDD